MIANVYGTRILTFSFLLFVLIIVSGCAKKTTVVLLTDPDGKVGTVRVATNSGEVEINQEREATVVKGTESLPTSPEILSEQAIEKDFSKVLKALPQQPTHFLLYFKIESTQLASRSQNELPNILKHINDQKSQNISVVGHADTAGDEQYNLRLSQKRSSAIKGLLVKNGVPQEYIHSTSHGEENPLIPTLDNAPEPRNRRVEVIVR